LQNEPNPKKSSTKDWEVAWKVDFSLPYVLSSTLHLG
jgi:hypothetical protein